MPETAIAKLEQQDWLDQAAGPLAEAVEGAYSRLGDTGQRLKNAMHGTWLGHPLHPVLTDIPIGAWTTAAVLDCAESCTGDRAYGRAADVAIGFGVAGALGAAVTGLTDWSESGRGGAKRLGLVHGLMNIAATALCASAIPIRRNGSRSLGQAMSWTGLAVACAASYLGGALVFHDRIGVTHADEPDLDKPAPALPSDQLLEGDTKKVEVGGADVFLARQHGRVCALADHCSHLGGPLSEGTLEDGRIVCPWHGSEFSLDDGHVIKGPATQPQPCFNARERDGAIVIAKA